MKKLKISETPLYDAQNSFQNAIENKLLYITIFVMLLIKMCIVVQGEAKHGRR